MSIETLETPRGYSYELPSLLELSDEQIEEQWAGLVEAYRTLSVSEVSEGTHRYFEEMSKLFLDAHTDRIDRLQHQKREIVLGAMLDAPAESFYAEFLELQRLFKGRTHTEGRYDGSVIRMFCTQASEREKIDYVFYEQTRPNGATTYESRKSYDIFGEPTVCVLRLEQGELTVSAQNYHRGRVGYEVLTGDRKEHVLAKTFFDTIVASAAQFERTPQLRKERDDWARRELADRLRSDTLLL